MSETLAARTLWVWFIVGAVVVSASFGALVTISYFDCRRHMEKAFVHLTKPPIQSWRIRGIGYSWGSPTITWEATTTLDEPFGIVMWSLFPFRDMNIVLQLGK